MVKGISCILVGYSTQSKGYRVYNKRTRLIVESIHIRFDVIKEMSETYAHIPSQQELDLLFGPLHDEFFTAGTSSVNKSSPTNNSNQQDTQPTTNIQPTSEPSTPTYVHAEENNVNQAEEEHLLEDEFTNPFCTPVQEVDESSSHNIEVRGNPSKPVQTRRKLTIDPKMCMFALTVSTAEPKNIREAMADSACIERAAKRRKLDEEVEDLKRHLQIVPNKDDDVYTEATPLVRKVILLVERRYPLSRFTLDQMMNDVRLQVEEESEVSLELLRFTRQQHQEDQLE
nr:hypothetical protein [Tanacetum cinerariifolium]